MAPVDGLPKILAPVFPALRHLLQGSSAVKAILGTGVVGEGKRGAAERDEGEDGRKRR